MERRTLLFGLVLLSIAQATNGQIVKDSVVQLHEAHVYDEMPYRLMRPIDFDPGKRYPVIVSLHGAGGRGTDNRKQLRGWNTILAEQKRRTEYPAYVLAPQTTVMWNRTHLENIKSIVKDLPSVDVNRIYILGHSMGGEGTYRIIQCDPDYFAAAAPSAGSGLARGEDFIDASIIRDIPIWAFHGDRDKTCPIERDQKVFSEMQSIGGNMKLTTWAGDGHGVATKMITGSDNGSTQLSSDRCDPEPVFLEWLFQQRLPHRTTSSKKVNDVWRPLPSAQERGLLSERVGLWREKRLWHMVEAEEEYLLSGFESRPGRHAWQGEHVGKWLHAATLAYDQTHDEELGKTLKEVVERLLAAQEANGYLGTYSENKRFYTMPADGRSWDVWSHRYNLYGLLTYERFHPDDRIVKACERMADLVIGTFGDGKADITRNGTRQGISSTTVLESVMMLYERTHEERFLRFAERIVDRSEHAPRLRLMDAMLKEEDVSGPGEGKAYQLMANLLGYLLLYEHTGDNRYLTTAENGWENIEAHHLYVTGGPWSRKMPYNGNKECFALPEDFDPGETVVETCSTTTWIQLNLHLLGVTGEARYAAEAERAIYNALLAAQRKEGVDWCYYTRANEEYRPYQSKITCCASSGPRALEMFSHYLIGQVDGGVSFAGLAPCNAILPEAFGRAQIKVMGDYPVSSRAVIRFEQADGRDFAIEFKDPCGARLASVQINGEDVVPQKNARGFYRISQNWKTGDEVTIAFEYLVRSHIELPKDGKKWVAFTYGPWALAQETGKGADVAEPFVGKDVFSQAASEWLEPCPTERGDMPAFRIRGTDVALRPYVSTGSLETGPHTYFQF